MTHQKRREQDEWYCWKCLKRWDVQEESPDCLPQRAERFGKPSRAAAFPIRRPTIDGANNGLR